MTQENPSSKSEEQDKEIEALRKKADTLQKMLDLTLDHEKNLGKFPKGHSFGNYEMT